jgi:superfamily I DNA/RNA helicase
MDVKAELKAATDRILASKSAKKLVVAGPGAGKTYLFGELLKSAGGAPNERLVLTFINTLKNDLERNLGDSSKVFTLHGYCQYLLRSNGELRSGLSEKFRCFPGLRHLIPEDWFFIHETEAPSFIKLMRDLACEDEQRDFYLGQSNFYDAVDFDDSVYRVSLKLSANKNLIPKYSLVLIDEFQDFNKMEASIIDALADQNSIVIAGDDDQALYSRLRSASWDYIRAHYESGEYEVFALPFCMRCPEVIVDAVNDVIKEACNNLNLEGRIPKPYRYYEPLKGEDSEKYPHIELIETTVQRVSANYFGRYIEKVIKAIPEAHVSLATKNNEPVALVIGRSPYRDQVEQYLIEKGLLNPITKVEHTERQKGLQILNDDPDSNLGWRIILACGDEGIAKNLVCIAFREKRRLVDVIPADFRGSVLAEAREWAGNNQPVDLGKETEEPVQNVAITSYEGSKGRSAQYVFLIGVHAGELPRDARNIEDLEICRFLVGLTRTKKQCSILITRNAMGEYKNPSEFLDWIDSKKFSITTINAEYWK